MLALIAPIASGTISGAAELNPPATSTTRPAVPTSGGVVVLDEGPADTIVAGGSLRAQSLGPLTPAPQTITGTALPRTGGSPVPLTLTALILLVAGGFAIRSNRRAPLR